MRFRRRRCRMILRACNLRSDRKDADASGKTQKLSTRNFHCDLPQVRRLRADEPGACCSRNASAERHTTSEICSSCLARGLVLRQIMPTVRDGCGSLKRTTDTHAERVSTATAISGIKVTPMPAPTICTSVDSEFASSTSRGGEDCKLQNDSA